MSNRDDYTDSTAWPTATSAVHVALTTLTALVICGRITLNGGVLSLCRAV